MATWATKSSTAKIPPAAGNAWTGGSAVSAGGGRGLAPALKEPLRVIAHIDMDAFYAQIEQLRDAALTGRPVVVVQYPTSNHDIKDMAPNDNRVVEGSASSIIAVSYEARPFGVKRGMKAGDARKLCPELSLVQVPTRNGKADISLYRHAGERVVAVLERAGGTLTTVEKASIDEVYVDVTRAAHALLSSLGSHNSESGGDQQQQQQQHQQQDEEGTGTSTAEGSKAPPAASPREDGEVSQKRWEDIGEGGWTAVLSATATTHVAGLSDDDASKEQRLADGVSWWARTKEAFTQDQELLSCGAAVVSRLRAAVRSELGYSCTAGVAHNKLLAKLCSNMHKPNAQTVLPLDKVEVVFHTLPVERVRGWGGKFGVKMMEKLGVSTAGEVAAVGAAELQRVLGDEEGWRAWEKSNAICRDPVKARSAPKSVGCSKTFPGKAKLTSFSEIERWLSELSKELISRLVEQQEGEGQTPSKLTVSFAALQQKGPPKGVSRCCRMVKPELRPVVEACMKMVRAYSVEAPRLTMLGVSAHGFADSRKDTRSIQSFFGAAPAAAALEPSSSEEGSRRGGSANSSFSAWYPRGTDEGSGLRCGVDEAAQARPTGNALGFPKATAAVAVEEARAAGGCKRPRPPEDDAAEVGGADGALRAGRDVDGGGESDRAATDDGRSSVDFWEMSAAEDERRREGGEGDGEYAAAPREGQYRRDRGREREDDGGHRKGGDDNAVPLHVVAPREMNTSPICERQGKRCLEEEAAAAAAAAAEVEPRSVDARTVGREGHQAGVKEGRHDTVGGRAGLEERLESSAATTTAAAAAAAHAAHAAEGIGDERFHGDSGGGAGANSRHRPLFGRGGSSGVFGDVDPAVLAELPPDIQREIWMQQGGQAEASTGQLQLRFSPAGKATAGGSSAGRGGGGRRSRGGAPQKRRGRGSGRGGGRRGRGEGSKSQHGSESISSFFGRK